MKRGCAAMDVRFATDNAYHVGSDSPRNTKRQKEATTNEHPEPTQKTPTKATCAQPVQPATQLYATKSQEQELQSRELRNQCASLPNILQMRILCFYASMLPTTEERVHALQQIRLSCKDGRSMVDTLGLLKFRVRFGTTLGDGEQTISTLASFSTFLSTSRLPLTIYSIHMSNHNQITNKALIELLNMLKEYNCSLWSLDLSNCYRLTDEVLQYMPPTLRELNLSYCSKISGTGLSYLPVTITDLHIAGWYQSNEGLKNLPSTLLRLNMSYCTGVNDQTLQYLPRNLEYLNLRGCFHVTEEGLKTLPQTVLVIK